MIKLNRKLDSVAPAILTTLGVTARNNIIIRYDGGERNFKSEDFNSEIYGHNDVKTQLIDLQYGKCAFCESKIRHISNGDVEHFRPKTGWVQEKEKLNKPGYYWLAYDWDNLMLSCQICNQKHKKNYFPLVNPNQRALSHTSNLADEKPVFIHPVNDDPETLITFKDEIPVSLPEAGAKGSSIQKLGLDRAELNEMRLEKLNPIRDLYNLALSHPETNPEIRQDAWNVVHKYFVESNLPQTQYSSMLKAFFRDNPLPDLE